MFQFIDLCILLGCDYCDSIKGIGPKRAVELINQYRNIETIIDNIDKSKYPIPEDWNYQVARELFVSPEITDPNEIEVRIYCQYFYLIIILSFFLFNIFLPVKVGRTRRGRNCQIFMWWPTIQWGTYTQWC